MAEFEQMYEAVQQRVGLVDLRNQGVIDVVGPEAAFFLHNLCTNDVARLAVGSGCEAFLTTHKAKTIAYFIVSRLQQDGDEVVRLDMTPGQADRVAETLNKYLISEQAEIINRTGELAAVRLVGPEAKSLWLQLSGQDLAELGPLQHVAGTLPEAVAADADRACWVRVHELLGLPGLDIFCAASVHEALWQVLQAAGAMPATDEVAETLRVEAGIPLYGKDIDEDRFVVEVGRTQQAISYTKGCYLGQEPIVMARDRGQINRVLRGVRGEAGTLLPEGSKLFDGDTEVGAVTSSVLSPRLGQRIGLAYLKRSHWEDGTCVRTEAGAPGAFEVGSLPLGK